jgi:hypothetical protein
LTLPVKKKRSHIALTWLLLAVFAVAQLPFSLLHHHEHQAPCALVNDESNNGPGSPTHLHKYEGPDCFVCAGYLLKKDYTSTFFTSLEVTGYCTSSYHTYSEEAVALPAGFSASRGPPFIS